jgi:hypothetical protein
MNRDAGDAGHGLGTDTGTDAWTDAGAYTGADARLGAGIDARHQAGFGGDRRGIDLNDMNDGAEGARGGAPTGGADSENLNDAGLDSALESFQEANWGDLSLEGQKRAMTDLAACVASDTGNQNPPEVVFRDDMGDGEYGGYNPKTNALEINENMLDDPTEAADTVAHEMWHAHQQQCAADPTCERGREYREGFDSYISPEYDYEGYQSQMVEAEARQYAQGFKDRISGAKGA